MNGYRGMRYKFLRISMIEQETGLQGWHMYHPLLLGRQRMVKSREEFAKPCDLNKNKAYLTPPERLPPTKQQLNRFHFTNGNGMQTNFFKGISRRVGLSHWVFWARINIISRGAMWCGCVVESQPPASWGKEKSAPIQRQFCFRLSPLSEVTYSQPGPRV